MIDRKLMLRVLRRAEAIPVFLSNYEGTKCAVCEKLAAKGDPGHFSECELERAIAMLTPRPIIVKTCKRCKTRQRLRKDGTLQSHARFIRYGRTGGITTVIGCEGVGTTKYL